MFEARCAVLLNLIVAIHCNMEGYVVGGEPADIIEFPHSAYLSAVCHERGVDTMSWVCGASIINQDILLTAAHCIDGCPMDMKILISAGSSERLKGHRTRAQSYVTHEFYDDSTSENDIGLVKMLKRMNFNSKLRRVAIMESPPKSEEANIAGWGVIDEDNMTETDYLIKLKQILWKRKDCIEMYGYIPLSTFCASSNDEKKYVSLGDSGSALMIHDYIQIGIVSYKLPYISRNLIVYTNDSTMIELLCLVLNLVITTHCTMEDFIVGGERATIVRHPHCAFLLTTCKTGVAFMCGGSILNQKIVITAAHCLLVCSKDLEPKIIVSVGSSVRNKHQTKVQDFIVHSDFNLVVGENDIALVKMERQFELGPKISRVAIMRSPPDSKHATVAGWGLIDESTSEQSNYLMKLQQEIWDKKDCIKLFGHMPSHTFCAAHKNHSRFASTGDSGSALVIKDYIQIGVTSFKRPKIADYVIIYTNVSQFIDWISKNARQLYCNS